jgi:LacI family transcriptional regulator
VIAFDDVLAQGVLAGLVEQGVDVPGTMSVVGCDDITAVRTVPPLTTISGPSDLAGRRAVELLLEAVEHPDPDAAAVCEVVPSSLVVRQSTGPAGRGGRRAGDGQAGAGDPSAADVAARS